jgi:hypothetical protein
LRLGLAPLTAKGEELSRVSDDGRYRPRLLDRAARTSVSEAYRNPTRSAVRARAPQSRRCPFAGRKRCSGDRPKAARVRLTPGTAPILRLAEAQAEARRKDRRDCFKIPVRFAQGAVPLAGTGPMVVSVSRAVASIAVTEFIAYVSGLREPAAQLTTAATCRSSVARSMSLSRAATSARAFGQRARSVRPARAASPHAPHGHGELITSC